MMILKSVSNVFWNNEFWLPPNVTWSDLESQNGVNYAKFEDLVIPIGAAFGMLIIKYIVEKILLRKIGKFWGLNDRKRQMPQENSILEVEFQSNKKLTHDNIEALAKKLDMNERQIERWFRQRQLYGKSSKLDKFCESGWKALFYTIVYIYGWVVLWDKTWFWHITDCWFKYPQHPLTSDLWFYYMIELSYYWSLIISQFFDIQRSDFWEMFTHHVATISLMCFSWTCNLYRIGSLVLWVHDCADVFLESAKMFKYIGVEKLSNFLFYGFAISWVVTRLGYFPSWIIYSVTVEAGQFIQYFPAYHVFAILLSILLILNLFWFYFIIKVSYLQMLNPEGKIEKDLRSETNSSD